jgi:endonuclease G
MLEFADRSDQQACVFTGPVFSDDDPEIQNQPNELPIKIPAGFWKVIAIKHRGELKSAGFLVWQRVFDREVPVPFDPLLEQVRLTTIEYLAGLSFASIRETDPLHFGAEIEERDGRLSLVVGTARRKPAVITAAQDIVL